MKRALVCGAGGFIGGHLVKKLRQEGYWVRGVDIKEPEFAPTQADEFWLRDLRRREDCTAALLKHQGFDEVYQLAADMGGMGFISTHECEVVRNNALININMTDAAARAGVSRYFFSSSACVYRDMGPDEPMLVEEGVYPAYPDNEYGWEKLYAERVAMTYGRHCDMKVRIGRFENCYGPLGAWRGGREKAPAAICRKVAVAKDGDVISVWGDGTAVRSFIWVGDLVEAVYTLMQSNAESPVNIGSEECVTVNELVDTIIACSGKNVYKQHIAGPVGVQVRYLSAMRMWALDWEPKVSLAEGIARLYSWVEEQSSKEQKHT